MGVLVLWPHSDSLPSERLMCYAITYRGSSLTDMPASTSSVLVCVGLIALRAKYPKNPGPVSRWPAVPYRAVDVGEV